MSRFRLYPDAHQERQLLEHCAHARYVWNLAVEQQSWWRPGRKSAPRYLEQSRQLTAARAENQWLRDGVRQVQEQALRDFDQAMARFFAGAIRRPGWRKANRHEGFRIGSHRGPDWKVRRISRHVGEIRIPKTGWVRFRWSRAVPDEAKSFRVTRDHAGRWHVAFGVIPDPVPAPGNGEVVGIDRGVIVTAALSTGEMLRAPTLTARESRRLRHLQRKLSRAKRESNRRQRVKVAVAKLGTREKDRRKDWREKVSTDLARRFDMIRIEDLEDLKVRNMTRSARGTVAKPGRRVRQKTALNREIRRSGWGLLACRLEDKAPGRVEKVNPAYTSQRCSACGHIAAESRKSQALFRCVACNYTGNADVNAAKNIAAGHAVTARGGLGIARPLNREPQLLAPVA